MELVLIDSSVWIDFYHPERAQDLKSAVREAIELDIVAINGIIAMEVLQGTANDFGFKKVLADMRAFNNLTVDWNIFMQAARLSFDLRRQGITIPTIDSLIAATAIENKCVLWHQDYHYELIAKKAPLKTRNFLL